MILAGTAILGILALFFAGYFVTRRTLTALVALRAKETVVSPNSPSPQDNWLSPETIELAARAGGGASIVLALLLMAISPQWGLIVWFVTIALGYGFSFWRFPR